MKILVIQLDDSLGSTAEAIIRRLQGLELAPDAVGEILDQESPVTSRAKVEALKRRCQRTGTVIQTKNVIEVTGIDESTFYKWMAGQRVSMNVRQQCEMTVALSADEFITRLISGISRSEQVNDSQKF